MSRKSMFSLASVLAVVGLASPVLASSGPESPVDPEDVIAALTPLMETAAEAILALAAPIILFGIVMALIAVGRRYLVRAPKKALG